jgi:general secretion pathway protein D
MRTLPPTFDRITRSLAACVALSLALGCAIQRARNAFDEGRYEEALDQYQAILKKEPGNVQARIGLRKTAPLAAEIHVRRAEKAQKLGRTDVERNEIIQAVMLDSSNAVATDWAARLERAELERRKREAQEDDLGAAKIAAAQKLPTPISPRSLEGVDLNFTRKTSLREIFQHLSKASGVNIILHNTASAQDPSVSVDLRGLTFQRILDTLMLQNDMFYKMLDPNTIMVFKKTPQNTNDYESKLVQTFYLSNAEPDAVRTVLQQVLANAKAFVDKRLNAITVQAKPNELAVAQRIVNQLDKAQAEVVVYLELVEVTDTAKEQLGLMPTLDLTGSNPSSLYRIGAITNGAGTGGLNSNSGGIKISKSDLNFLFAPMILDMLKSNGEGKLLANPSVRVISGGEGLVEIGDKISTTQSSLGGLGGTSTGSSAASSAISSLAGGALASQTSYQYESVGVKIKVKPRVHFNGDITVDLDSTITTLKAGSTPGRPDMGQRNIKTTARLRDGETAVFGGLLKEDETKSLQGLWGITDIPILGKLFGHTDSSKSRIDVVLSMRSVIVRKPDLDVADFEPFDPDLSPDTLKPFAPKPEKKLPAGIGEAPTTPMPSEAAKAPSTAKPAAEATKPAAEATKPAADAAKPAADATKPAADATKPAADATKPAVDATKPAADAAKPEADTESPLVFFLSPLSVDAAKGEHIKLTIFASGAQGLTSGTMPIRIDPRLKLVGVTPGDFITADGGTLKQTPGNGGILTLAFTRPNGATDSGTFAQLELEAVDSGKATLLIQEDGKYLVGANPIPARVVNSLVTIQ